MGWRGCPRAPARAVAYVIELARAWRRLAPHGFKAQKENIIMMLISQLQGFEAMFSEKQKENMKAVKAWPRPMPLPTDCCMRPHFARECERVAGRSP